MVFIWCRREIVNNKSWRKFYFVNLTSSCSLKQTITLWYGMLHLRLLGVVTVHPPKLASPSGDTTHSPPSAIRSATTATDDPWKGTGRVRNCWTRQEEGCCQRSVRLREVPGVAEGQWAYSGGLAGLWAEGGCGFRRSAAAAEVNMPLLTFCWREGTHCDWLSLGW